MRKVTVLSIAVLTAITGMYAQEMHIHRNDGTTTTVPINTIDSLTFTNDGTGGQGQPCPEIPSFTYGDQTYNTVLVGNQCWMAENLNYLTGSSWCYDNNPANCATYGRLYNWETALNACPPGWHLPTDEEWKILEGTVDSQYGVGHSEWDGIGWRGSDVGKKLKATNSWSTSGNGTDDFGFGALAGGRRDSGGDFYGLDISGDWWSAKESSTSNAWYRRLYYDYDKASRGSDYKGFGFSIRCLKDSGGSGNGCEGITEFTYGGQTYSTVEIADQCWMAENLNFATGSSWCYDDNPANCAVYGRIYNWQTAMNACPPGWHLPTDEEWKRLEGTVDSQYGVGHSEWNGTGWRGSDVGEKLKATTNWFGGGNGTDDYGFGALAGGYRDHNGYFSNIEHFGYWWSATDLSTPHAWIRSLWYNTDKAFRDSRHEGLGYSVRCIKD